MGIFALIFVSSTFVLAGFVKGVIGLGMPTVAMGLLVLVMAPAQAAALLTVPLFLTNFWQAMGPGLMPLLRRMWSMLLGICLGTGYMAACAGQGLLTANDGARASVGFGAVLVLYGLLGLSSVRFSVSAGFEPWLSPLIGVITGVVAAATGVYMIPAVPYLQALGLEKDDLVQALGLSFMVSTLALAGILVQAGSLGVSVAGASLLGLVPALVGMALGQWVRSRVQSHAFRICFFLASIALGAHLLLRGLV
jgi:uncharacterized membrane protein YfcA